MEYAPTLQCSPTTGAKGSIVGRRVQMRKPSGYLSKPSCDDSDIEIPIPQYWIGLYGGVFAGQKLRLRLAGNIQGPRVLVLGGISAGRFVTDKDNAENGWWSDVACTDGGIDLNHYCVVGFDYPTADLPIALCPEDFAELIAIALKTLDIRKLFAIVGSSFGGMIGLAFARKYPARVGKLCVISAAHRPHPMAQAWRLTQRRIIEFAVQQNKPEAGVALARELAMTTYRTPEEFAGRFSPALGAQSNVAGYLTAKGEAYANGVDAARYLTLSAAIDRHNEDPAKIKTPTLVIGVDSDRLAPLSDVEELERRLDGPSSLAIISSPFGHDAFLKESKTINNHLKIFLSQETS